MNHQELPELLDIEFKEILPRRKQDYQQYTQHPNIQILSTKQWENGLWTVNGFGWITLETAKNMIKIIS